MELIELSRRATFLAAANLAAGAFIVTLGAGSAVAASAPVAVWNMNETSGTTMVDSSGNGNDGTTYNVEMTGSGYSFDGSSSKVVVPNSASLNPGTSDFSYSVEVQTSRIPPQGTDYDLMRKGTAKTSGGEYKLEIVYSNGIGKALCLVKDAAGVSAMVKGTTNVADGAPHSLTCVKHATSLVLTVDQLAPRTKTVLNSLGSISSAAPLTISCKTPTVTGVSGDFYTGVMRNASVSVG